MKLPAALLCMLLAGCSNQEQARAEKIEKLEILRRSTQADLARQLGECQAVSIEFKGEPLVVASCLETYRMMVEIAQPTFANIDKRLAEIERTGK